VAIEFIFSVLVAGNEFGMTQSSVIFTWQCAMQLCCY